MNKISSFREMTTLVIGDLVADQYLNGTIARVSREAPVFILRHDQTSTFPGGGANAAANVAALGGKSIVVGVLGSDANAVVLKQRMDDCGIDTAHVVTDPNVTTTTKIRVLAGQKHATRQQVIRIDYENDSSLSPETQAAIAANVDMVARIADAIIISDYNYGVATLPIFAAAQRIAAERQIPLVIDSRFRLSDFHGATSATPNQDEVEQLLGKGFAPADCERLREDLGFRSLLVTNGNKGMLLVEAASPPLQIDAVGPLEPVDVTGAGDTVIAAYTLGLATGLSFADAASVANHAGGLVVMKKGTATVTADELIESINSRSDLSLSNAH